MALPTSMAQNLRRWNAAGLGVEVYPSTVSGLSVEIQFSSANSTASSVWRSVILPPTSAQAWRYFFAAANSTRTWYAKARYPAQPGYSAGAFTPTINARPVGKPDIQRPLMVKMTARGNVEIPSGSDVYLTSGKTTKVGTQITAGTVTKTLRLPAHECQPAANGEVFSFGGGYVSSNDLTNATFQGPVVLPPGVTIVKARARMYRQVVGDAASVLFVKSNSTGGLTTLTTLTHNTTSWQTVTSAALSQVVGDELYTIQPSVDPVASAIDARFMYFECDYTMPDYGKSY